MVCLGCKGLTPPPDTRQDKEASEQQTEAAKDPLIAAYSPITSRNEKMLFQVNQHKPCGGQEVWLEF